MITKIAKGEFTGKREEISAQKVIPDMSSFPVHTMKT